MKKVNLKLFIKSIPIEYLLIKDQLISHFQKDHSSSVPLKNIDIIDIGCGGGLLSVPLSKLGANVTAIDASKENIDAAIAHNKDGVDFKVATAEEMAMLPQKYDCVLAIEIIEHVGDIENFISSCKNLLKDNGILIISTLNKTFSSYFKGIILAENILKWVPKNTHDWQKFVKPSLLAGYLRKNNLKIEQLLGMNYKILSGEWYFSNKIDTNYIAICKFI